jgi:hypothetical protein
MEYCFLRSGAGRLPGRRSPTTRARLLIDYAGEDRAVAQSRTGTKSKSPLAPQLAAFIAMRHSWEGTMTTLQAFLLGMMVAWTPSLVLLGWYLLLEDRQKGVTQEPA